MSTPEDASKRPVSEQNLKWIDLPVATHKGKKPHFDLKEILLHADKTTRYNCQFKAIQNFLECDYGHILPAIISDQFSQFQLWQLVMPTHVDVAQLLFLGRKSNDMTSIAIDDAQATVYIHRGAEGGDKIDGGKYISTWVEISGIFPDSNGEQRIVGARYGAFGSNPKECIATGVSVSFSDAEYERHPAPIDSFIPIVVDITDHKWGIYLTHAYMTQGMIDSLPQPHKRVINLISNPKGGITIYEIGGKDREIDFDQGISMSIKEDVVEVGLSKRLDRKSPWTIDIPRTLISVDSQVSNL